MTRASVYLVRPELDHFRSLLYDLPGEETPAACYGFFGESKLEAWPDPPVYIDNLAAETPDIWYLASAGIFAFTPSIIEKLEPFVSMAGELLPLSKKNEFVGESLYALNILNLIDGLDMSRSDFQNLIIYPDFIEHRLGEPTVFIVPQHAAAIFCVEWDDVGDSFMKRIERHELRGVRFEEVWSSTRGPRDVNLMLP